MISIRLTQEIFEFVSGTGAACRILDTDDAQFIDCHFNQNGRDSRLVILPCGIDSQTPQAALLDLRSRMNVSEKLSSETGCRPVTISEDRWNSQQELYKTRLAVHLGQQESLFARNCSCRKISKIEADDFMQKYHTYGQAKCRHRYGLFDNTGDLVAAGTFSNARKWIKGGKTILSYEWIRYAAADGLRISGGMGKVLKTFIRDISPDDIMTYSDSEWSEGDSYRRLGFVMEGEKEPVLFRVDPKTWKRSPVRDIEDVHSDGYLYYMNCGSRKFRLKLTDYSELPE